MPTIKADIRGTGTATLLSAQTGRIHLQLANMWLASAYAAGVIDILETTATATSAVTVGGMLATEGGYQVYCWGMDNGFPCSATGSRLATQVSGNSCTGLLQLVYNVK